MAKSLNDPSSEPLVTLEVTYAEAQMAHRALDAYKHVMSSLHVETQRQGAGKFDLNVMTGVLVDLIIKVEDAQRAARNPSPRW